MRDVAERTFKELLQSKGKRTLDENANDNERVAPFSDSIMATKIPSHVKVPTMKYLGLTNPDDHLMAFDIQMDLYDASGAVRCRLFPITLQRDASKWYRQYRERTIYSWKQFSYEFSAQFCIRKDPTFDYTVVANIKQGP